MSAFRPDPDFVDDDGDDPAEHQPGPGGGTKPNGHAGTAPEPGPKPDADPGFCPIDFPSLAGMEPPERRFVVRGWLPGGCVTGMWGEGGIGKSMLAQQIATCVAMGVSAFGFEVEGPRPVVGVFSEDDDAELWRRQVRVNRALGVDMHHLRRLHLQGRAGLENTLAAYPANKPPIVQPLFSSLVQACERHEPGLVVLDNVAQLFGGNENDRYQVSHFCNLVGGLTRRFGCAVLLLGHPSKAEGSQYSGSTAWNAAVRSRLFLARDKDGELQLTRSKANYAPDDGSGTLPLGWVEGVLRPAPEVDLGPMGEAIKRGQEEHLERAFLGALDRLTQMGEVVAFSPQASNHAPKVMLKLGLVGDLRGTVLRDAMMRLVERGELVTDHPVKQRAGRRWSYGLARAPAEGERRPDAEDDPPSKEESPSAEAQPSQGDDGARAAAAGLKTDRGAACSTVPPSCRGEPRRGAKRTSPETNRGATAARNRGAKRKPKSPAHGRSSDGLQGDADAGASDAGEPRSNRGADTGAAPKNEPRSRPRSKP